MLSINNQNLCELCFEKLPPKAKICPYCNGEKNIIKYPTSLQEGTILVGRYSVGKVLGKGGFGITYLCYDLKEKRKVAIKEYLPDTLAHRNSGETFVTTFDGEQEELFRNGAKNFYEEAQLVARFNGNPNIISVYEFFYSNNTTYFVMEYMSGMDLKRYLKAQKGKIPEAEALYIANCAADALLIVHSADILHRDISPDNIFLCENGGVKLIDFGAARHILAEASQSLSVILKPGFAPFEQYQSKGKQGPWTDIYALGASVYLSVSGKMPDDATTRLDAPELNLDGITSELAEILTKMMAVRHENRYQKISEVKEDLKLLKIDPVAPHIEKHRDKNFCERCGKEIPLEDTLCDKCKSGVFIPGKRKVIMGSVCAAVLALFIGVGAFAQGILGNISDTEPDNPDPGIITINVDDLNSISEDSDDGTDSGSDSEKETGPESSENSDESEQTVVPEKAEEPEQTVVPEKAEEPEQTVVPEKAEEPEQAVVPEKIEESKQSVLNNNNSGSEKTEEVEHTHTYKNAKVTTAATCTTEGVKTSYCSCGATKTEKSAKIAHTYANPKVTKAATCTAEGVKTSYCSCGATTTEKIAKIAHTYKNAKVTTAATCTTEGVKTSYCSCGATKTESISKTGHSYSDSKVTKEATCSSEGVKTLYCSCGATRTESIGKTDHNFSNSEVTQEPTYSAAGVRTYYCSCGATRTESIPMLECPELPDVENNTDNDEIDIPNPILPSIPDSSEDYDYGLDDGGLDFGDEETVPGGADDSWADFEDIFAEN